MPRYSSLRAATISKRAFTTICSAAALGLAAPVAAQTEPNLAQFMPKEQTSDARLDFSIWDEALRYMVFRMGRSARDVPPVINPTLGTRRIYGHTSLYRLEGNRIIFSFLEDDIKQALVDYREDLEATAGVVDIASLERNEQLAFWINLHNVAVISKIAEEYPVKWPSRMKIGPEELPLDEAKFITVNGVSLSPQDIRTKIVYPNWKDPKVIYGFYRGEIGGPSIADEAFDAGNVSRLLDENAREFVNSLRGVEKRGRTMHVSKVYEEAQPYFFPNWTEDMREHIDKYARDVVGKVVEDTTLVEASIYEQDIGDLAGGDREPNYTPGGAGNRIPANVQRMVVEHRKKTETLLRRKELQPRVIVIDMNDPTGEGYEVE